MTEEIRFKETDCRIAYSSYSKDGSIAIKLIDLEDSEVFSTATVWIEGLAEDEVAIRNYSENEGIYDALRDAGVIEPSHRTVASGFVQIPVCRLIEPSAAREF